jgi:hypothetical protein
VPDEMPDADKPATDAPAGAREHKDDHANQDQGTRHTDPGEEAAGWKAASEASKRDSDDSHA